MVKRGLNLLLIALGLIFISISYANASISFSNIQPTYNLGDIISAEVSVNPIQEEFLIKTDLICKEANVLSFNSMPDDSGKALIKIPLSLNTVSTFGGSCYFKSVYADENQASRRFDISRDLAITLNVDSFFINPGDEIAVSGSVTKANGEGANGVVEVKIPILILNTNASSVTNMSSSERINYLNANLITKDETFSGTVVDGSFSVKRTFARDIPAGEYKIEVGVYEVSSSGKRTNSGVVYGNLKVSQILTKIDINMDSQGFNPGENINFTPILLDQSSYEIKDDVTSIIKKNETRILEKITPSGEAVYYNTFTNVSSGYYEIESSAGEFKTTKTFFINQKAKVSFLIANDSLIVTNIGNMEYDKDIEIDLNNKSFIKHVSLGFGESKEFKLTGLDERYDIKVSDGENEMTSNGIVLTGGAIGVSDIKKGGALIMSQPIVWIFLLIIVGAVVLFIYRDYFRKNSVAKPFDRLRGMSSSSNIITLKSSEERKGNKVDDKRNIQGTNSMFKPQGDKRPLPSWANQPKQDENKSVEHKKTEEKKPEGKEESGIKKYYSNMSAPTEAEQTLVKDGQKSQATVLLLKTKGSLTKIGKETVERAIDVVYDRKGAVYHSGDFVYVIFTPLLTKTFKNEIVAAKCAEKIVSVIKDYNSRFKEKIDFGIGINSGEIIDKVENRKLKFTAMGNLLPVAKKLADSAKEDILLSKTVYEKAMTEIKAIKKNVSGTDAYEIRQIVDYDKNKKFIDDFMKRQARDMSKR